ncbi:hypothetical protein M426DRAFT_7872 [Hypoxylon sp. CI-4A]|nr:hypothetical protein M426DRAFT_7872 [Hypoxylon sp. CI-4A]
MRRSSRVQARDAQLSAEAMKRPAATALSSGSRTKRSRRNKNKQDELAGGRPNPPELEEEEDGNQEEVEDAMDVDDPEYGAENGKSKGRAGKGTQSTSWEPVMAKVTAVASKLPGSALDQFGNNAAAFGKTVRDTGEWIKAKRPLVNLGEVEARLPVAEIDVIWTQEKEDELNQRFATDPAHLYLVEDGGHPGEKLYTLWRKAIQLRRVFPTDIIGAKEYLQYGTLVESNDTWIVDPNWSRPFCEALDLLIIGSPCEDDMPLLALFIRYAVACRINDRRQVPVGDDPWRPFLQFMQEGMRRSEGSLSLPEIGRDARRDWTRLGRTLPWEARVMHEIERLAFHQGVPPFNSDESEPFQPYSVIKEDLETAKKALNSIKDMGGPSFTDLEDKYAFVSTNRARGSAPNSKKELNELNKLRIPLLLADMRIWEKRHLQTNQSPSPDPNEDLGAVDGDEMGLGMAEPDEDEDELAAGDPVEEDLAVKAPAAKAPAAEEPAVREPAVEEPMVISEKKGTKFHVWEAEEETLTPAYSKASRFAAAEDTSSSPHNMPSSHRSISSFAFRSLYTTS